MIGDNPAADSKGANDAPSHRDISCWAVSACRCTELDAITVAEAILTPEVIRALDPAGGDFGEAVPFCLIESYVEFLKDAEHGEYVLDRLDATECQIAARRVVAHFESSGEADYLGRHPTIRGKNEGSHVSLSKRFRKALPDGTIVHPRSALDSADEGNCQEFLTSPEAQRTINAIVGWHESTIHERLPYSPISSLQKAESRRFSTLHCASRQHPAAGDRRGWQRS